MCEKDGYGELMVKGLPVVITGLFAIFDPGVLTFWFVRPVVTPVRVYHIIWFLAVLVFIKRMTPRFNAKMSSGKVFESNFRSTGADTERKRKAFRKTKKRADSGAFRSGLYWTLLLVVMWAWRHVGMLSDVWIYVIVLFFVFMDQFCITVFCPFQWLIENKCCSTCRINNWGYCMALSPLIFIPTFWTYSVLLLSVLSVMQWEYLYFKYPERFYEIYNANLMCRNCRVQCRNKSNKNRANSPAISVDP